MQLREDYLYYSVPYQYVGKKVKLLYDSHVVEAYYDHNRIALHIRKPHANAYTTMTEHMPPHHRHMQEIKGFNKEDLLRKLNVLETNTLKAATLILDNSIYIEQNYKSCFGMLICKKSMGYSGSKPPAQERYKVPG